MSICGIDERAIEHAVEYFGGRRVPIEVTVTRDGYRVCNDTVEAWGDTHSILANVEIVWSDSTTDSYPWSRTLWKQMMRRLHDVLEEVKNARF